jgi:hypothetical protein
MRLRLVILALALWPYAAGAVEAPTGQVPVNGGEVLRGHFVDERQAQGVNGVMRSSGHFVVAPAQGLIWGIEKPFPTTTIITPVGAAQTLGGLAVKLPVRNLRHLYDMVGGALAGNWNALEADFSITQSGSAGHWQRVLTPRRADKSSLPYVTISVSGGRFVENIVMTRADGGSDAMSFTDEALSPAPPSEGEMRAFGQVKP